ncbi:MAG: Calcium/calmodulin dependent protein kinase Association [Gemmataceae bacterium]|nr:Calcium/calmodulin dependent protein kinase Association [Gemmataceae bacterium]
MPSDPLSRGGLRRPRVALVALLLPGLVLLAGMSRGGRAAAAPGDDEKAVRGVLDAQVAAWNKGDLDGFMAGYWNDDGLFYISGAKSVQGWKALKERYQKAYQGEGKEMGKLKFAELNVETLGPGVALVRGKWEVTMSKETVGGWFTLVVRKLADGWKVTHDHTSK